MNKKIYNNEYIQYNKKRIHKYRRYIVIITAILITVMVLLGIGRLVTYNAGYISKKDPFNIKEPYEIKEPTGDSEEINISEYKNQYPEIENIPNINRLQYKVYLTNESIETLENDFKQRLEDDGFEIRYEGIIFKDGIPLQYYGFLKGLTAIGIIMTNYQNLTSGHETMILYTTGNVFDFRGIITWFKESDDSLITP